MDMKKLRLKGPKWLKVNDPKNSESTTFLNRLDWDNWWTDGITHLNILYIHVPHLKGKKWKKAGMDETVHRVYCAKSMTARIGVKDGELYWIVD